MSQTKFSPFYKYEGAPLPLLQNLYLGCFTPYRAMIKANKGFILKKIGQFRILNSNKGFVPTVRPNKVCSKLFEP